MITIKVLIIKNIREKKRQEIISSYNFVVGQILFKSEFFSLILSLAQNLATDNLVECFITKHAYFEFDHRIQDKKTTQNVSVDPLDSSHFKTSEKYLYIYKLRLFMNLTRIS